MPSFQDASPWLKGTLQTWDPIVNPGCLFEYQKQACIFRQGLVHPFVYVVKSGRVMMQTLSQNGRAKIIMIVEKGGLFGDIGVIEGNPEPYSAIAIVDSSIYRVPLADFLTKLQSDPKINQEVIINLSRQATLQIYQILGLSFGDIEYRVAAILLYLISIYGKKTTDGIMLDIPFTHQDMADLIKSSRVSVSKVIHSFNELGILKKINSRYVVCDLVQLEMIVSIII